SQQVTTTNGSLNIQFDVQNLVKGTYLLRLTKSTNETQILKFVK
ncbi:MAG: T9SS type A sorting domain-containing protein, partial [Chitinophagaceae bacterium]